MAQPVVSLAVAQPQGLSLTSPTMLHQQQPLTTQLQQQPTAITAQLQQQQPATLTAQIQQQQQRVILPTSQRSEGNCRLFVCTFQPVSSTATVCLVG